MTRARQVAKLATASRTDLREAGLRRVQLVLPDTRNPDVVAQLRREAEAIAAHDVDGREVDRWIEAAYEWPEP